MKPASAVRSFSPGMHAYAVRCVLHGVFSLARGRTTLVSAPRPRASYSATHARCYQPSASLHFIVPICRCLFLLPRHRSPCYERAPAAPARRIRLPDSTVLVFLFFHSNMTMIVVYTGFLLLSQELPFVRLGKIIKSFS